MSVKKTKSGDDPRSSNNSDIDEVVKEMEEEGLEITDTRYKSKKPVAPADKEEEDDDKDKPPKKESKKPKAKKEDEKDEETEEDEEDEKDKKGKKAKKEEEESDEEDEDEEHENRTPKFLEGWQVTKLIQESEKRLTGKLESIVTDIKALVSKPASQQTKEEKEDIVDQIEDVQKIADEHGLDAGVLQKLAKAILSQVKLPKDISEKLESLNTLKEEKEQKDFWEKQDQKFSEEFGELRDSEDFSEEFKVLSAEQVKIVRQKLYEFAFTKRYAGYSLTDLLTLKHDDVMPEKKKTATPGRGGSQRASGGVDLSGDTELTSEQQQALSDEDFDTYSENMKKKHKLPLKRGASVG